MEDFAGGLFFGGTELIEPIGHGDRAVDGQQHMSHASDESDADEDIPYANPQTGEISRKRNLSPNAGEPDPATKKYRVQGGKAAVAKRIVADYDSDDGRIIDLKQQGYPDDFVAKKLVEEGRIRYVPKTVGSRWLRLRKALERAEEDKLDDELSDWHEGEDDLLAKSFNDIEKKYDDEILRMQKKKWNDVSANLAHRLNQKKYTAKACMERYEGNLNGTSLLPIEADPEKQARKVLREIRIAEAKRIRAQEAAEVQRLEDEKQRKLRDKKEEKKEQDRQREAAEKERRDDKKDKARVKKEKRDNIDKLRAAKNATKLQARKELAWKVEKIRGEKAKYNAITGGKVLRGGLNAHGGIREDGSNGNDNTEADDADYMSMLDDNGSEMSR